MALIYRYSEWDGTQEIPDLDADGVLEQITDDLMNFGDLQHALRNLLQRGMRNPMGQRMQGLRDLLQQLRQQRRQKLEQFNLSSVFDDIQNKLQSILDKERDTIADRLGEEATRRPDPASNESTEDDPDAGPSDVGAYSNKPSQAPDEGRASDTRRPAGAQARSGERRRPRS